MIRKAMDKVEEEWLNEYNIDLKFFVIFILQIKSANFIEKPKVKSSQYLCLEF